MVESFAEDTPVMLSELEGLLRTAAEAQRGGHAQGGGGADGEGGGAADGGDGGHSKTVADARAVLHKLKGSALTLGASAVGTACEAVRAHCISGDLQATLAPSGEGTFAALQAAFNEVMGAQDRTLIAPTTAFACFLLTPKPARRRAEQIHGAAGADCGASGMRLCWGRFAGDAPSSTRARGFEIVC